MRLFKLALTIALAMFIIDGATAMAQATYYSRTDGAWRTPATWSYDSCTGSAVGDSTYPDSGDDVIVCDDTVTLSGTETCDSLNIQQNGEVDTGANTLTISDSAGLDIDSGGLLDVSGSGGVTLAGDGSHTVNGTIELDVSGSDLSITSTAGTTTLSGDGKVYGQDDGALISIASNAELINTLSQTTFGITGALQITGDGDFTNQGIVHANSSGEVLLVNISGTLGDDSSAQWRASNGGLLEFGAHLDDPDPETALALAGDFYITHADAEIQIDQMDDYTETAPFFVTSGHLEMSAGTLDIHEDTQMGTSQSELLNMTGGQITVAVGKRFDHL